MRSVMPGAVAFRSATDGVAAITEVAVGGIGAGGAVAVGAIAAAGAAEVGATDAVGVAEAGVVAAAAGTVAASADRSGHLPEAYSPTADITAGRFIFLETYWLRLSNRRAIAARRLQ